MRVWMRVVAGCVIGVTLGMVFSARGGDLAEAMRIISSLVVNVGRFAIYPLIFFGLIISLCELRADKITGRIYLRSIGMIAAATAVMVVFGTLIVLLLAPRPIRPIFQEATVPLLPTVESLLADTFPRNMFAVFAGPGNFLLPVVVSATLLGFVFYAEGPTASPATDVVDSLARIAYRLNSWVTEIVGVLLIAVSAFWVLQLRMVSDLALFSPLVMVVAAVAALFVLVVYPLLIYFLGNRHNPAAWLYGLVPPAVVAFFSGDSYFSLGSMLRVSKENLGISREVSTPVLSLAVLFAKPGSAMVIAAGFITVLRSYIALEIPVHVALWIMGSTFLFSFLLGSVPGSTVLVGLSVLANGYGQGLEEIYLILLPALPILTGIAVLVDTITSGFIAFLIAQWERKRRIVDPLDFV